LDQVLLYGLCGSLLFGPLALGAVEPWSIAIIEACAGILLALWAARQVAAGELEIVRSPLFSPMVFFGGLIVWQLVGGRTAYRASTFSFALLYCAYGLQCFLMVQCLRKRSQVKILAWVFSGYGFVLASFALLQGITSNGKLYWFRAAQSGGWIYGPYVNHNHYAGLMEMLVPIPLLVSLNETIPAPRRTLAAFAAALMASTIFLSGSRGGMVAFAVQMVLLAPFLIKQKKSWKAATAFGVFLLMAAILLAWLGGADLVDRVASLHEPARSELSGATRLKMDRDAWTMFLRKPVSGWGLGVFGEVYPQFSSFPSNQPVGMAHNDYLQLLAEMGLLGFAAAVWFLATLFCHATRKVGHTMSEANAAVTLAALLGIAGILIHSFVDFNLQIPGNAALFYVLCVLAATAADFEHGPSHRKRHRVVTRSWDEVQISATASTG
jgi:O-antigen ligase